MPQLAVATPGPDFGGGLSSWTGVRTPNSGTPQKVPSIPCMSLRPDLVTALDSVIGQLQALRVALDEDRTSEVPGTASSASFEWISSIEQEPVAEVLPVHQAPLVQRAIPWTAEWDLALQVALQPADFLALDLSPLDQLLKSSRLLAAGEWVPLARLARGLAAGRSARRGILAGLYSQDTTASLPVGLRNTFYICLYCPSHPQGFWTGSSKVYFTNIKGPQGERFHPESVSHSFPSRAESAAFLLGAQAEWPPHLQ